MPAESFRISAFLDWDWDGRLNHSHGCLLVGEVVSGSRVLITPSGRVMFIAQVPGQINANLVGAGKEGHARANAPMLWNQGRSAHTTMKSTSATVTAIDHLMG